MELVRLRSGREVLIRPIRPNDGERLSAAYDRLSPQSQYRRFFGPKPHLSGSEIRYLVEVDGGDHFALVAIVPAEELVTAAAPAEALVPAPTAPPAQASATPVGGREEIIAVARFVRLPEDSHTAEPAIVVGDRFQGEGLATVLLERLADAALERGISQFRATVLAENIPARRLVRGLAGGDARERSRGTVKEIEIELPERAAERAANIDPCRGGSRFAPARRSSEHGWRHWVRPSTRSKPAAGSLPGARPVSP
jgi:GNAT superfamily N-acetyltransferase